MTGSPSDNGRRGAGDKPAEERPDAEDSALGRGPGDSQPPARSGARISLDALFGSKAGVPSSVYAAVSPARATGQQSAVPGVRATGTHAPVRAASGATPAASASSSQLPGVTSGRYATVAPGAQGGRGAAPSGSAPVVGARGRMITGTGAHGTVRTGMGTGSWGAVGTSGGYQAASAASGETGSSEGPLRMARQILETRVQAGALLPEDVDPIWQRAVGAAAFARAFGLYLQTMHTYPKGSARAVEALAAVTSRLQPYLSAFGTLRLAVQIDRLCIDGTLPVFFGREDEIFPFFELFRDGVRQIALLPRVTDSEVEALADAVLRSWQLHAGDPESDGLTVLAEAGLEHVSWVEDAHAADERWLLLTGQEEGLVEEETLRQLSSLATGVAIPGGAGGWTEIRHDPRWHAAFGIDTEQMEALLGAPAELGPRLFQVDAGALETVWDRWHDLAEFGSRRLDILVAMMSHGPGERVEHAAKQIARLLERGSAQASPEAMLSTIRRIGEEAARAEPARRKWFEFALAQCSTPSLCRDLVTTWLAARDESSAQPLLSLLGVLRPATVVAEAMAIGQANGDAQVRGRLGQLLAHLGSGAVAALSEALAGADTGLATTIVGVLAQFGAEADPALARAARSPHPAVRVEVVRVLQERQMGDAQAMDLYRSLVMDDDDHVHVAAVRALETAPRRAAVALLREVMAAPSFSTRPPESILGVCRTLGRRGGGEVVAELQALAKPRLMHVHQGGHDVQVGAIMGLAETGAPEAASFIESIGSSMLAGKSIKTACQSALRVLQRRRGGA